jgi:hypothetical protein
MHMFNHIDRFTRILERMDTIVSWNTRCLGCRLMDIDAGGTLVWKKPDLGNFRRFGDTLLWKKTLLRMETLLWKC